MSKVLTIDYESRSIIDLKKYGVWLYAGSPYTDVLVLSLKVDEDPAFVWVPKRFRSLRETDVPDEDLQKLVDDAEVVVAHNAFFERCMTRFKLKGILDLPLRKVRDTAAQAGMSSLPRHLDGLSKVVTKGKFVKDMEGNAVMRKLMAPRSLVKADMTDVRRILTNAGYCKGEETDSRIKEIRKNLIVKFSKGEPVPKNIYDAIFIYNEDPNLFKRMAEYSKQDVEVEYRMYRLLPKLPPDEQETWFLDQIINDRGVLVDRESAIGIKNTIESYMKSMSKEALKLTNGEVTSMKSPVSIVSWLEKHGICTNSISKENVKDILKDDSLDENVRKFLEFRQFLGKSSVGKYDTMVAQSAIDGRCHGLFVYHAATTGRWSGSGVQPQNLPRPAGKDNAVDLPKGEDIEVSALDGRILASGDLDLCRRFWKDPVVLSSDLIRTMFSAPQGKDLICADFSSVEARGIAYLAGEEKTLEGFRKGLDVYKVAASGIFHVPYESVDHDHQRKIGKTAVLACGYGGGWDAMLRFGADKLGLSKEEGLGIVKAWRESNSHVVSWWYALTRNCMRAAEARGSKVYMEHGIVFQIIGDFMTIRIPSGRMLFYPFPKIEDVEMAWSTPDNRQYKRMVTAMTENSKKMWVRAPLSHVKLSENITQAFCRDLLRNAMFRIETHKNPKYDIVMHVHDEVIAEVNEGEGSVKEFEDLMSMSPKWASGMPLKAEGWRGKRYRK